MLTANVIFHAALAAHVSWVFLLPIAVVALCAEAAILWAFNPQARVAALVVCALAMNVASFFAGYAVTPYLFIRSGLVIADDNEFGIVDRGPDWQRFARYGFLQAAALSIVVEGAVLVLARKWARLRRVILPVCIANCLSYALLYSGYLSTFGRAPHSEGVGVSAVAPGSAALPDESLKSAGPGVDSWTWERSPRPLRAASSHRSLGATWDHPNVARDLLWPGRFSRA